MEILNEHARRVADDIFAAQLGAFPRRYIAGIDSPPPPGVPWPMTLANKADAIRELTEAGFIDIPSGPDFVRLTPQGYRPPQKETTTMIEKKNFVTPPVKTPAGSLAHRHLGSLVTITLPSGAEITDILVGVRSGVPQRHGGDVADKDVVLYLQNVGVGYDPNYMRDLNGEFPLDPKSVVLVRRPKVVKTRAAKQR